MGRILVEPTSLAQWRALVLEAESESKYQLSVEMESYLVFTLMRFVGKPEMARSVLALDYLESLCESGRLREENLRDVGDRCLLFSGMFPRLAGRRRVKISYFVNLGRSAYNQLAVCCNEQTGLLYSELSRTFVALMDILQVIRDLGSESPTLSPIEATELWQDTGSQQALKTLNSYTSGVISAQSSKSRH